MIRGAVRPQENPHEAHLDDHWGWRELPGSFKRYQSLLGQPETAPSHNDYGQILDSDIS